MAKKSSKFYGLITLFAIIVALIQKLWYIILPIVSIIIIIVYYFNKQAVNQRELVRMKAIKDSEIDEMSGIEFEFFISQLMLSQGYKTEVTKGSHDFGVDIIAEKDGRFYPREL